jgi:hypothetical protein
VRDGTTAADAGKPLVIATALVDTNSTLANKRRHDRRSDDKIKG